MRKKSFFILFCLLFLSCFSWSQGTRKAIAAGSFYDERAAVLSSQIDNFFRMAKKKDPLPERIFALIAPHAGYPYSGSVAAQAYRQVQGKDFKTVVIIGPSHRYGFEGCSIYLKGSYETPLGEAKVDESLASEISKASGFKYISQAHLMEHSVEVQVPFIQKALPQAKIVPIVMGYPTKETLFTLANALAKSLQNKNVLVIASTDLSHYLSKKKAQVIDANTISLIQSFKTNTLIRKLERRENIMCGGGPVVSTLLFAQEVGNAKVEILQYSDSSPKGRPETEVVGYMSAVIGSISESPPYSLSNDEKTALLRAARSAIDLYVKEKKIINFQTKSLNLLSKKGAFVTLKKRGQLRGCIGFIDPVLPLYQTVIQAAIYAATRDNRFPEVSSSELDKIHIEISVLTLPQKISDPNQIKVGKHGLIISKDNKKGLLLPQVPVENYWSRKGFLQNVCLKAGLPENAWKTGAEIFVFEALVFDE